MSAGTVTNEVKGRAGVGAAASLLCVAAVIGAVAVSWACRRPEGSMALARATPVAPLPVATQGAGQSTAAAQVPAGPTVTTLTPSGFTPNRVTHSAGVFKLKVKNQSGLREVTLRLSNSGEERLWEVKLTDKVRDWTGPVELDAGSYTLSEAAHPDWTCRVEVTP